MKFLRQRQEVRDSGADAAASVPPSASSSPWTSRRLFWLLVLVGTAVLAWTVRAEYLTSSLEAHRLSKLAGQLTFQVEPGPSDAIRYPGAGPYDLRLGYARLPHFIDGLHRQGYEVTAQARMSPDLLALRDWGLSTIYREKDESGLDLAECHGLTLYSQRFPRRVYGSFDAVPRLLVDSLLFVENRELLDPEHPERNPAIEWDRFSKAALDQAHHLVDDSHRAPGGSTLATQIEKYRHSPEGRTDSGLEKLRQMASASVRAYLDGENTLAARRRIVLSYLNTVPLSAQSGFGEVNGVGDGLWAWYARDFNEVNELLRGLSGRQGEPGKQVAGPAPGRALAYKQALSLLIAQRRPSHYLVQGEADLNGLTNSYLRVMTDAGVIPAALRDAALPIELKLRTQAPEEMQGSFIDRKAATAVRGKLAIALGMPRAYDLDRLDLRASTTLNGEVQRAATELLRSLGDPKTAKAAGLYGFRLFNEGDDTSKIVFSFTLFERGEGANLLRVQTDNVDQPFDLNEGARLDFGSTAKFRTLVTYLELVAELHANWSKLSPEALSAVSVHPKDQLARWARDYLRQTPGASLKAMLEAAMDRSYSGNPGETFFTGSGAHHFENFEPEEDHQMFTVREALKHSVNLAFVRILRDVVYHLISQSAKANEALLDDRDDPARMEYLSRFADQEGREFLVRFYRKYKGRSAGEAEELLLHSRTQAGLAAAFFGLEPQADAQDLGAFLARRLGSDKRPGDKALQDLVAKYGPERWSLADRGYLAGVHPLELWVASQLRHRPDASLSDLVAQSREQRQDVYAWLFKTRHKGAQDRRIRNLIEQEAFGEILRRWRRLGYPFEMLTPSYATALGASGDRPAALAELMGIIVNHGVRQPVVRVPSLQFGSGTPYETRLEVQPAKGERLLPAEVADTVHEALAGVVEGGTAGRLKGSFVLKDGTVVQAGGKTGTGDHRFTVVGKGGQIVSSRVVSRTGALVFYIGDRYFGTIVAYVQEPYAARYKFTSALPAQLLKALVPTLLPLLNEEHSCKVPGALVRPKEPTTGAERL
ncbi:MAG: transglycosylase domain-containing protein [Burkholderiaceae bacterium]|nr:transglycosylase domain-containing protein [Burkholderiaceae bacterium]